MRKNGGPILILALYTFWVGGDDGDEMVISLECGRCRFVSCDESSNKALCLPISQFGQSHRICKVYN